MPASLRHFLMLCSVLLLPWGGTGAAAVSPPETLARRIDSSPSHLDPLATIVPALPSFDGNWRISEADSAEEETGDPDDLGIETARSWAARPALDPGTFASIRRDRAGHASRIRSPILRC